MSDVSLAPDGLDGSPPNARGIAISTSSQLGAKGLHLVLNIVSTLAIIRYLGPDQFGDYVLVLTTTLLVGLLADFGLAKLAVREISRNHSDEHEVLGTVIGARLALAMVAMLITQFVLLAFRSHATIHLAAGVASLMYLSDAVLAVVVVFHVRLRQHYEALIRVVMEMLETGLVLSLIYRGAGLAWLFVPPVIGSMFGAAVAVVVARRRFGVRFRFARHRLRFLLREALPVGPALLIGVIYLKLDALMLAAMRPSSEVGLYGSAYQPIEYLFLGTAVVINVVFPLLARAHGIGDAVGFLRLYRRGTETLIAATLLVPVTLYFVGEPLLVAVYGADYAAAAAPMRLLAMALVLMTVNGWQSFVLLAGGEQRATLRYNLMALALAVGLCLVLISRFGLMGAPLAVLGTAVYVLWASTKAVEKRLDAQLEWRPVVRILSAGALTWLTLAALTVVGTPWLAVSIAAGVVYTFWLVGVGVVRPSQLAALRTNAKTPLAAPLEAEPVGVLPADPIDLRSSREVIDLVRVPVAAVPSVPVTPALAPEVVS